MNISFSPPDISEREIEEVTAALRSGWITTGPKTKLFEKKIAAYCGTNKAVCLNSATAALEMTLRLLGIGPGDEVITSAYTYTASASVIDHVGAKIVLVDVEPGKFTIDCDKLADAITPRTKAVIPVDIGGVPCDYARVIAAVESKKHLFSPDDNKYLRTFDRPVILADAAHSFRRAAGPNSCISTRANTDSRCDAGEENHLDINASTPSTKQQYNSPKANTTSHSSRPDFTSFSFHAVKNLTTAEGGAVIWQAHEGIDDEELYHDYMLISLHGQSKDAFAKLRPGAWEYDIIYPGYKCNMTDITAGIGLAQLERYDGLIARRLELVRKYDAAFLPLGADRLDHFIPGREGNGHLYMLRPAGIDEETRNLLIDRMAEAGVACNVHFKPLPMHTAYKRLGFDIADYPNAYRQYASEISLPIHTRLTDDEADYVASTMAKLISSL